MSEHTKGPWSFCADEACPDIVWISAPGETEIAMIPDGRIGDARRIVACVNACAGIDTDFLERTHAEGYESGFRKHIECEQQRDKLLSAVKLARPLIQKDRDTMDLRSKGVRQYDKALVAIDAAVAKVEAQS